MSDSLHVIVGLGETGLSCARFLKSRGIPFAVADTRLEPPHLDQFFSLYEGVPTSFGPLDAGFLKKAARIVLSPGVSQRTPVIAELRQQGIPVIGDIELFAEAVDAPVIAITGTNAKSTVTTLVGLMMKAAGLSTEVGGNLGVPALDLLHPTKTDVYVLELSSFQLETTYTLKPKVATVLNITPDHMDRYLSIADYKEAKQRVYQHCQIAICNRDDANTNCDADKVNTKTYFTVEAPKAGEFGLTTQAGVTYLSYSDELLMPVTELPIMGKHYQANALSAMAIAHGFGLGFEPILQVLREFTGLPHRCQFIRELDGVSWINDSKGTNVGATLAAIQGLGSDLSGKLVIVMGGVGKNADFSGLAPVIQRYARHVVLIGEAAPELACVLSPVVSLSFAETIELAILQARQAAVPGDGVLLSPACASFDMFKNYEHRGQVFMEIVRGLN